MARIVKPREYLRQIRAKKNLTQYHVALKAGFRDGYYNLVENGHKGRNLNAHKLLKLAKALDVDLETLCELEDQYFQEMLALNGEYLLED